MSSTCRRADAGVYDHWQPLLIYIETLLSIFASLRRMTVVVSCEALSASASWATCNLEEYNHAVHMYKRPITTALARHSADVGSIHWGVQQT